MAKTQTVSIRERTHGVWCVSFDGTILGDSRGYTRERAILEARKIAAIPYGDWEMIDGACVWIDITVILDPAL